MMAENAADGLTNKKDEIKKSSDFEIKTKIPVGHISYTIIKFADKEKVDLISIGNVGRSGISKTRTRRRIMCERKGSVSGDDRSLIAV